MLVLNCYCSQPKRYSYTSLERPNCGCCKDWIIHLEKNNFSLKVNDQGNNAARARLGMPQKFASCHTALVGGYVIEGHVPAEDIQRLLKEKPQALGLAVRGCLSDLLEWTVLSTAQGVTRIKSC